ncbi:MAG: hypothetical protein RLZZ303_2092 [Candidatus Hydrogenedentota bacterium]
MIMTRKRLWAATAMLLLVAPQAPAEPQPFMAFTQRLGEALEYLGSPLPAETRATLERLAEAPPTAETGREAEALLDALCLAKVNINPEARVKVDRGPAPALLQSGGWKSFLIKVENEGAVRAELVCESPQADPVLHRSTGAPNPNPANLINDAELAKRFIELAFYHGRPLEAALSGMPVEYKVLQIYTNATAPREASLQFHIGEGTQDIGHRGALPVLFEVKPPVRLIFEVLDHDGAHVMASFTIRDGVERLADIGDAWKRPEDYRNERALSEHYARPGIPANPPLTGVYPLPSRRVADRDPYPDFFFQPQVYRRSGEEVLLAPGAYDITWTRGPEYLPQSRRVNIPEGVESHRETFQLKRWIHLAAEGWYSGDHHVHAGGCSHYESPEAGVKPEAMLRQAQGEDLNVACVLTWGPCWYHQKSFFEGRVHPLSAPGHLLRYDVEVSGFPSSHAGHVCLLRLREDDYPGTTRIEEWPSYTLPVLQWGKSQGGVVGYAHSGWGLEPMEPTEELPNLAMPKFDGIGANEYIMTVTHDAVDFISAGDTPLAWELNIWYHTLNCGFRTRISGESDYPCIFDERVGMVRSYAPVEGALDFDKFVQQLKQGVSYVSDGRSHLLDFRAGDAALSPGPHEANVKAGERVSISARVAAHLPEQQSDAGRIIADSGMMGRPYWHIEKARLGATRRVPVELIVNGIPVAVREIDADGAWKEVRFEHRFDRSSWVALRVKHSSHTNPLFLTVDGAPIRAAQSSAAWCRRAVDHCWAMKAGAIHEDERAAAQAAYDHARLTYDRILAESLPDAVALPQVATGARALLPVEARVIGLNTVNALATAGWKKASASPECDAGPVLRATTPGERVRWSFEGIEEGRYELRVWVPEGGDARAAAYSFEGKSLPPVDQASAACTWVSLGTHAIDEQAWLEVKASGLDTTLAGPIALIRE